MVRASDANAWNELISAFVFVEHGGTQADTGWLCKANSGGTLETTAVEWVQFSSAGLIEVVNAAGTGVTMVNAKSGNQFPVKRIAGATGIVVADVGGVATVSPSYGTVANTILQGSHHGSTGTAHGNATTSVAGFMSNTDKTKLDGVATGANNYVHPTGAGNNHLPTGGNVGQILKNTASGTATWQDESPNATHTGEVTGATVLTIAANAVTTVKILDANVNNFNVVIMVYETATGNTVEADVTARTANSYTLTFSPVPVAGKYTIITQG